jgi:putative endonuclease
MIYKGLENRWGLTALQGSNPCLSAMFFVYILQSEKDKRYYYGCTCNLATRLKAHNSGKVRSTKNRRPLRLIYFETFSAKREALIRESFFKSKAGYAWLKNQGII